MKSMTGFAYKEQKNENMEIYVEIRSVNNRYRDISLKLSRKISPLEDKVKTAVAAAVARGKVDISVKVIFTDKENSAITLDREILERYLQIANEIKNDYKINSPLSIKDVMELSGVIKTEDATLDLEDVYSKISPVITEALEILEKSKTAEGESLKKDFEKRITKVRELVEEIAKISKDLPLQYRDRLVENIKKYDVGELSEDRLMSELALYSDRINITEELVRLGNHMNLFEKTINLSESVGRKLDFILQEINREANTIASKSQSSDVSALVIEVKSELEKIREQVQNIE